MSRTVGAVDIDSQPAAGELGHARKRTGGHDWIEELRRRVDGELVPDVQDVHDERALDHAGLITTTDAVSAVAHT